MGNNIKPPKLDTFHINDLLPSHLALLKQEPQQQDFHEARAAPIFTAASVKSTMKGLPHNLESPFPQYGLLAGQASMLAQKRPTSSPHEHTSDPRIFFNITAPSSTFICGSQGSGKSHTLSCLLENCLFASNASKLEHPLTGLVFHYDSFISDAGGSPCEAAFLASNREIVVRVLCSPSNVRTIERAYAGLNVQIEPLRINESDLNTKRMLDLMAVNPGDGPMPLYLHLVTSILRDMRIEQQEAGMKFDYQNFKRKLLMTDMSPAQLAPLNQRLDTLESFMTKGQAGTKLTYMMKNAKKNGNGKAKGKVDGNDWAPKPGLLTIVDLSCPCVTPEGACSLFNICLSIFLEQDMSVGRVIALDEAHKYMNTSAESSTLTNTLLASIRLQRHLGARVIISTQEPTISPALLDLSSTIIVHRFTSPEWLKSLKRHIAGAATDLPESDDSDSDTLEKSRGKSDSTRRLFAEIVRLRVGEALLFSPSAIVDSSAGDDDGKVALKMLGDGFMKIRVRGRLTTDGGKSAIAA